MTEQEVQVQPVLRCSRCNKPFDKGKLNLKAHVQQHPDIRLTCHVQILR